jgi:hypothetical protein
VHPHLAADVGEHLVAVFEFDSEHCVGQRFGDGALELMGPSLAVSGVVSFRCLCVPWRRKGMTWCRELTLPGRGACPGLGHKGGVYD